MNIYQTCFFKVKMNWIHSGREAAVSMSGVIKGVIDDNKLYTNISNAILADKNKKNNFLISQPKHMLWVLKRTVSMRRFF